MLFNICKFQVIWWLIRERERELLSVSQEPRKENEQVYNQTTFTVVDC